MTSRRDFLRAAGGAIAGTAAAPSLAAASATRRPVISEGFAFPGWSAALAPVLARSVRRDDRAFLGFMNSVGLARDDARAVLTLAAPGVELFTPEEGRALAREANDRLAAHLLSVGRPGAGLATVASADPRAAHEAERALGALGLSGLSLAVNRAGRLDQTSLWPIYAVAEASGAAIYLPASFTPAASDIPYRANGGGGVLAGASAESAAHMQQLILGGVFDAFPRLQVILSRLGEGTPYWYADMVARYDLAVAAGRAPARHVDDYFRHNLMITTSDVESLETAYFTASILGADRVVASVDQTVGVDFARGLLSLRV